ncbi:MAG: DUF1295 domain-containing protein [Cellulosilyticum sp.]|nr:DUF1295 domain-containing protein [Cellulosilyticum sp.]
MVFTSELGMLFLVAALLCSCGFYKFLYFFSIGYGLAIAGEGIFLLFYFKHSSLFTILACLILIFFGLRLASYLLIREAKNKVYRKVLSQISLDNESMNLLTKTFIWIPCIILYVTQVSPIFFGLYNKTQATLTSYIGLVLMACGVALEAIADLQKTKSKKKDPHTFCTTGLYKWVRCPNYLGEIVLWTGVLITGFDSLISIGQWIIALIGYIGILYVMLSGTRRLEIRQDETYGQLKAYKKYKAKTPILIPFLPLYSVKSCKWLKA